MSDQILESRISKLSNEDAVDFASITSVQKPDELYYRYLATPSKYPWGSSTIHIHDCISSNENSTVFTTTALQGKSIHFITDSALIIPKNAKIIRWTLKLGKNIIQNLDSWFAGDIFTTFKRGIKSTVDGDYLTVPAPFYYTDSTLKALPLFMPNSPPPYYEFEIIGVQVGETVKLMNEYCSSKLESQIEDISTVIQHIPTCISNIGISANDLNVEIPLSSNKKLIKAIYIRVYQSSNIVDLDLIKEIEFKNTNLVFPGFLCRNYFKNKFFTNSELPYYIVPFCPNPKSNMPEYGEVFDKETLIIRLKEIIPDLKIDIALETLNRIVWLTKDASI